MASKTNARKAGKAAGLVALVATVVCTGAIVMAQVRQPHPARPAAPVDTVHTVTDGLNTYQPCEHEYGQGPDGTYPCLWDGDTMGNHKRGAHTPRFILYVRAEDGCPVVSDTIEWCAYAAEWDAPAGD
jgi:hypothetical protein